MEPFAVSSTLKERDILANSGFKESRTVVNNSGDGNLMNSGEDSDDLMLGSSNGYMHYYDSGGKYQLVLGNDDFSPRDGTKVDAGTDIDVFERNSSANMSESEDVRDWNSEFQNILDSISDDQILTEEESFVELSSLASDFVTAATTYGRVIISEKHLPVEKKTIKPSCMFGGIAGGEKYFVQGILFKFAVDWRGLYGNSDEGAAKVAQHDMKGLKAVYNTGYTRLCVPLMVLIEYRGFLLIAMSRLPIGQDTLKYGSMDGGLTLQDKSPELNELMKKISSAIGLKSHQVSASSGPDDKGKQSHMPCDLEGHIGRDTRFYAVDFSRLIPPAPPRKPLYSNINTEPVNEDLPSFLAKVSIVERNRRRRADHLTRLLRPELIRSNPVPLSSDAFSLFAHGQEDCKDVRSTHARLHKQIIPAFSGWLFQRDPLSFAGDACDNTLLFGKKIESDFVGGFGDQFPARKSLRTSDRLVEYMHKAGINVRCLGDIWGCNMVSVDEDCDMNNTSFCGVWKQVLMVEMIGRVLRQLWRARLREVTRRMKVPSEFPFKKETAKFLNEVFGNHEHRDRVWNIIIRDELIERYFTDGPTTTESIESGKEIAQPKCSEPVASVGTRTETEEVLQIPNLFSTQYSLGKYFQEYTQNREYSRLHEDPESSILPTKTPPFTVKKLLVSPPETLLDALDVKLPIWTRFLAVLKRFLSLTGIDLSRGHSLVEWLDFEFSDGYKAVEADTNTGIDHKPHKLDLSRNATPNEIFSTEVPFENTDVYRIPDQIKKMNIVDYAEGTALFTKARRKTGMESERLARLASLHFDSVLRDLEDPATLCTYGFLCDHLKLNDTVSESYYRRAIAANPSHARSLYYYAMLLERRKISSMKWKKGKKKQQPEEEKASVGDDPIEQGLRQIAQEFHEKDPKEQAREYYLSAIEANPRLTNALKDFGNFLSRNGELELAHKYFKSALEVDPNHPRALVDYASFLWKNIGKIDDKEITTVNTAIFPVTDKSSKLKTALKVLECLQTAIPLATLAVNGQDSFGSGVSHSTVAPVRRKIPFDPRRRQYFLEICVSLLHPLARTFASTLSHKPRRKPVDSREYPDCETNTQLLLKVIGLWRQTKPNTAGLRALASYAEVSGNLVLADSLWTDAVKQDDSPKSILAHATFISDALQDNARAENCFRIAIEKFPSSNARHKYAAFLNHLNRLEKRRQTRADEEEKKDKDDGLDGAADLFV